MRKNRESDLEEFRRLFSSDVELMEARYNGASIYKYFHFPNPEARTEFLSRPTIKFAHKHELIDASEFSKRWEEFGWPFDKGIFEKFVRRPLQAKLSNIGSVRKALALKAKQEMPWLSRRRRREMISSRVGKRELSNTRNETLMRASAFEEGMPVLFPSLETEFIRDFAETTGVLSLTANPTSPEMWKEYAAGGAGFVLQYDANHAFFMHRADDGTMRKVIRPVFYRDDEIPDFWQNPYYLFLVKHTRWRFEREWRVIKALDQCQKIVRADGSSIYVLDAPPGLITSIIFGYRNSSGVIDDGVSRLIRFDPKITFKRTEFDGGSEVKVVDL